MTLQFLSFAVKQFGRTVAMNCKIQICIFWRMSFYSSWFMWFNFSFDLAAKVVQAEWKRWWFEEDWFSRVDMKKLKIVMFMYYLCWIDRTIGVFDQVFLHLLHLGVWGWFVHYRFLFLHEATIPKFMSCLFSNIISGLSILLVFFLCLKCVWS
jgi:hypothetical protein